MAELPQFAVELSAACALIN